MYEYYPQQQVILVPTQTQYTPQFWQAAVAVIIDIMILAAMGAFVLSQIKKSIKGEEVSFPGF